MGVEKEKLSAYAVVEMMGHRKIVGQVKESDIGISNLIRVDVLGKNGSFERTEYIGAGSIYCLTIVSEDAAKAAAFQNSPEPTWAWGLNHKPSKELAEYIDGDDDEADEY